MPVRGGKNNIFTPCLELHSKHLLNMVIKRSFIPEGHEHAYKVLWNLCPWGEKVTYIHGITVSINSFQNRSSFILCHEPCRMFRELLVRWTLLLRWECLWSFKKRAFEPELSIWLVLLETETLRNCYQVVLSGAEQDECCRTRSTRQFRLFKLQEGVFRG